MTIPPKYGRRSTGSWRNGLYTSVHGAALACAVVSPWQKTSPGRDHGAGQQRRSAPCTKKTATWESEKAQAGGIDILTYISAGTILVADVALFVCSKE